MNEDEKKIFYYIIRTVSGEEVIASSSAADASQFYIQLKNTGTYMFTGGIKINPDFIESVRGISEGRYCQRCRKEIPADEHPFKHERRIARMDVVTLMPDGRKGHMSYGRFCIECTSLFNAWMKRGIE